MLELCIAVAVGFVLVYWWNADQAVTYVCPQCGSRNGDHAETCSWNG